MISIGLATAIGILISNHFQRKKNNALAPKIEEALRAQGPLTLPALAKTCGFKGFMARGKVALALNDMVVQSKVADDRGARRRRRNFRRSTSSSTRWWADRLRAARRAGKLTEKSRRSAPA